MLVYDLVMDGPSRANVEAFEDTLAMGAGTNSEGSVAIAVRQLQRLVGVPSCAVGYVDAKSRKHKVVVATGYSDRVIASIDSFLVSPLYRMARPAPEIRLWAEQPEFVATPVVVDLLRPAGYREGTSLSLQDSDGTDLGSLHLNLFTEGMSDAQQKCVLNLGAFVSEALLKRRRRDQFGLTARETQVLGLIAAGASNPEIAVELFISRRTVATHVENLLPKLGATTRVGAAVTAVRNRLV